jgi:hypothetical protein
VTTLCKGEVGLRQELTLYHTYYNFCLPHASLRHPLLQPEPTHGTGSAKRWQPRTPAMAAGLTDHIWTLREVCSSACHPGRSQQGCEQAEWWEAARGGGLSRRRAATRPASRASSGVRGPLGGHERPPS